MKLKRMLSSIVVMAMLLSTMSFTAFATAETDVESSLIFNLDFSRYELDSRWDGDMGLKSTVMHPDGDKAFALHTKRTTKMSVENVGGVLALKLGAYGGFYAQDIKDMGLNGNAVTLESWIYKEAWNETSATSGWQSLLSLATPNNNTVNGVTFNGSNVSSAPKSFMARVNNADAQGFCYDDYFKSDAWQHVVLTSTYADNTTTLTIYVDGVKKVSFTKTGEKVAVDRILIGDYSKDVDLKVAYATLKAYNKALTENEIKAIFDAEKSDYISTAPVDTIAMIGDREFVTLQSAVEAANPEDTIVLLSDIVLTESIEITKNIAINLAGNEVSYTSDIAGEAMITNRGVLTINDTVGDGVINYNYTGAADSTYGKGNYTISNAGTLIINGGKITIANLSNHAKYPIDNNSTTGDAILVINGGHLYNYNTSAIRQFCNSTTYENSVTINGGLIEGYCAIWVQNPGKNTVKGSLSITGGEIKTTAKAWVNGDAEIKDVASGIYCTIDGDGGAWSEDSAISITGGIINENVKLAEEAPKAITIGEDAVYNGYVDVSIITWDYDQDSGYYYNGDTKFGMIRFLFAAEQDGVIEEYGIRYTKADDISEEVTTVSDDGDVSAFYGDLYSIEENADTRYYAIAFIKVNGKYLWSDIVSCTPNWSNNYSGYIGGNE